MQLTFEIKLCRWAYAFLFTVVLLSFFVATVFSFPTVYVVGDLFAISAFSLVTNSQPLHPEAGSSCVLRP